jgi:hypothetical protein
MSSHYGGWATMMQVAVTETVRIYLKTDLVCGVFFKYWMEFSDGFILI